MKQKQISLYHLFACIAITSCLVGEIKASQAKEASTLTIVLPDGCNIEFTGEKGIESFALVSGWSKEGIKERIKGRDKVPLTEFTHDTSRSMVEAIKIVHYSVENDWLTAETLQDTLRDNISLDGYMKWYDELMNPSTRRMRHIYEGRELHTLDLTSKDLAVIDLLVQKLQKQYIRDANFDWNSFFSYVVTRQNHGWWNPQTTYYGAGLLNFLLYKLLKEEGRTVIPRIVRENELVQALVSQMPSSLSNALIPGFSSSPLCLSIQAQAKIIRNFLDQSQHAEERNPKVTQQQAHMAQEGDRPEQGNPHDAQPALANAVPAVPENPQPTLFAKITNLLPRDRFTRYALCTIVGLAGIYGCYRLWTSNNGRRLARLAFARV